MTPEIIVSIISASASLIGVIFTVIFANKLTLYRIEQLEKKVELHNNAVERLYVAEGKINGLRHEMNQIHNKEFTA